MFEYLRNVRIKTISYGMIVFMIVAGGVVGCASFSTLREVNDAKATWDAYDNGRRAQDAHHERSARCVRLRRAHSQLQEHGHRAATRATSPRRAQKAQDALQAIAEYRGTGI